MTTPRKSAGKARGKPFEAGNPGKPKGTRHKVTRAVEALMEGEAEALSRKAIDAALEGDMTALRICLDRIAPTPKDRPVQFDLPELKTSADLPAALAALLAAVAGGDLTPGEGANVATVLERYRAAVELEDLDKRIAALEART